MDTITPSSGNVFADLGLSDAVVEQAKVGLAVAINDAIAERGLRQREAADLLNCAQPQVSLLANYRLSVFSLARLLKFLTYLDRDVEIGISKTTGRGNVRVQELEASA
jgi:predicted XRE-type DNA-binding protein